MWKIRGVRTLQMNKRRGKENRIDKVIRDAKIEIYKLLVYMKLLNAPRFPTRG